jgi:predicted nucleic acid-binding protein
MAEIAAFSDSSPLVYLAKLESLHILQAILGPVGIPARVYEEAMAAGKLRGKPDAIVIERALDAGLLVRHEMDEADGALAREIASAGPSLGRGECEAIACAEARAVPVILQDRKARSMAGARGVRTLYPHNVLMLGLLRRRISLEEFKGLTFGLAKLTEMSVTSLLELHEQAAEIDRLLGRGSE